MPIRAVGLLTSLALLGACGDGAGRSGGEEPETRGHYKDWRAVCNGEKTITVKKDDTVFAIIKAPGGTILNGNNRTWQDLPAQVVFGPVQELNPQIDDIDHIEEGDKINIPEVCSADQTTVG